jgi:ADP-ribosylglycohydrolase
MNKLMNAIVYGTAVGDALGVPVEFIKRSRLKDKPVTTMFGNGSHNQVAGTWSDDTSLLLAISDGISDGYNLDKIANNFVNWYYGAEFTAHNKVFDAGIATINGIDNIKSRRYPLTECGGVHQGSQGNGSLMRTLALVPLVKNMTIDERYRIVSEVSSLTHAHINCKFACFFLVEYAIALINCKDKINYGMAKLVALIITEDKIRNFITQYPTIIKDMSPFDRILGTLEDVVEDDISGSGFVISTLESSIWCIINSNSYSEAVLKAVNLGDDTDTTAAVTGGLAAILYGVDNIPAEWIDVLANKTLLDKIIVNYKG